MNNFYESIKQGLKEAIEYERGNLPNVRTKKVSISPVNYYTSNQIKEMRLKTNLSQRLFANALGVSIKTVEAWEAGINRPSGSARRILGMLEQDSALFDKYFIVENRNTGT